jgi:ADP-heptose:LPS heptosyltransferase
LFFDAAERARALRRPGTVLFEPNVPWHKSVAVNKDWGRCRYQALAEKLRHAGWRVLQTSYGKVRLDVETIAVNSFRDAAAVIASVDLVIVPEGGLHHAAAAVGTKAIVIFGGFISPRVTGYDAHINLTGGAGACGSLNRCDHCRKALDAIEVDHVYALADAELRQKSAAIPARID